MNKLSEDKIQILIDLVRNKPMLYDKRNPAFKKVHLKEKIWKEIAQSMNADENDCKTAWRSLRDQFLKSMKDIRGKTGQAACENRKPYKNFERLLFLKESVEPRRHVSNYDALTELDAFMVEESNDSDSWSPTSQIRGQNPVNFVKAPESGSNEPQNKRKRLDFESCETDFTLTLPESKLQAIRNSSNFCFAGSSQKSFKIPQSLPAFDFESCSQASTTNVPIPDVSPIGSSGGGYSNDMWAASGSGSGGSTKKKKAEELKDTFTGFLDKIVSKIDEKSPDNIDLFFQSVAQTVKSFNLAPMEIAKLQCEVMNDVTERIQNIMKNRPT